MIHITNLVVMAISAVIILSILLLYLASRGKYEDMIKPLSKKNYAFLFMLPVGLYVLDLMKYTYSDRDRKLRDHFSELYSDKYALYYLKIHLANKISSALVFLLVVSVLSIFLNIQSAHGVVQAPLVYLSDNTIYRPPFDPDEFWDGSHSVDVIFGIDGGIYDHTFNVHMQYPDERTSVELVVYYLEKDFISPNLQRFEEGIYSDLHFQNFARLGCSIVLETDSEQNYLTEDGRIIRPGENATEPPRVTARFVVSRGEEVAETFAFDIKILPDYIERTLEEEIRQMLIDIANPDTSFDYISLPTELRDLGISWRLPDEPQDNSVVMIFVGGLFVVMLLFFLMDSDVDKKIKLKRERIKSDFPEFISKYVLLLGCGMTTYDSFRKIMDDNMDLLKMSDKHPIYMELETTLREIELGKAEVFAYEDFGLRCRINEAMKFSSLVTQNLRRGTDDLQMLLRKQVNDVWEVYKADMRRRGEEAGTKMMFPMMLSLVSVLLVVIYPIFTNVNF